MWTQRTIIATIIALVSLAFRGEAWLSAPLGHPAPLRHVCHGASRGQMIRLRRLSELGVSAPRKKKQFERLAGGKPLAAVVVDDGGSKLGVVAMVENHAEASNHQPYNNQQQQQQQPPAQQDLPEVQQKEMITRLINGVFLTACFGLAIYSILNINQGMTRGWTQSEIAMRIPLDTWSSYEAALEESPVATKTSINVIIYLLGDWLSQTVFAKQNVLDFDLGRTLRNGLIGLCFGPLVHEYYQFSDAILPLDGGFENRILKIIMDQTIYLSTKCSLYIFALNTLQGESVQTSAQAVKDKIGGIVLTAWKFWPLVHCITYSVIPARHRILWVNCVDLVWNAILASLSQKSKPEDDEAVVAASPNENADDIVSVAVAAEPKLILSSHQEVQGHTEVEGELALTSSFNSTKEASDDLEFVET